MLVLLIWPESLMGPSFQLSFAAVTAIVALHESRAMQRFLARRDEPLPLRWGRGLAIRHRNCGFSPTMALAPAG